MMDAYGQESIANLMPLVVNVLENLDSAMADNQVRQVHTWKNNHGGTRPASDPWTDVLTCLRSEWEWRGRREGVSEG